MPYEEKVREATSLRRTVSLRWFPEQPNLEDEIYSKGGRFVTPWFSPPFLFRGFLVFVAGLVLEHLVGLELEHISFFHAQVPLVPNPCQCHSSNPPQPLP